VLIQHLIQQKTTAANTANDHAQFKSKQLAESTVNPFEDNADI
jgi:hypothetical protein